MSKIIVLKNCAQVKLKIDIKVYIIIKTVLHFFAGWGLGFYFGREGGLNKDSGL